MKKLFIICAFIMGFLFNYSQITFQRTYGGIDYNTGYSVQQTSDTGYIIMGRTSGFVYLIKTNVKGDVQWAKSFEGGSTLLAKREVHQTNDGGYIIVGATDSLGAGETDVCLIKTDENGIPLWTKTYGGANSDIAYSVKQTIDGGYIITGETHSFGNTAVYLIKTDENGDVIWTKTFGSDNYSIRGYSIQQTSDTGYIIAGRIYGVGSMHVYLIKTNTIGGILWTKSYSGLGYDYGYSVQQTTDTGYIIVGYTGTNYLPHSKDVFLIKTDNHGNVIWTKTYGGDGQDGGQFVQQTTDGGYIVVGHTSCFGSGSHDVYLIKTDSNGDTLWTKTFGGADDDGAYSVQQTTDGGYILTGHTNSFGSGSYDVYLIKTDANGNSGCYENSTNTVVSSPTSVVNIPANILGVASGTIVTSPPTITIDRTTTVNVLCTTVSIQEENFRLKDVLVFPNPFTASTTLSYELEQPESVSLCIYNHLGLIVYQTQENKPQGKQQLIWNAERYTEGVYYYRLQVGDAVANGKMVKVR